MKKILKSIGLMSLMFTIAMVGFGSSIAQATTYTLADVTTHNTPADCWIIVNNNVYNLTSFITTHSGGSAVITAQCGKNGTASFASGPHSASTLNAISSFLLGPLTIVSPILTSMTIVPSSPTLIIGGEINLKANPKDQNGAKFNGVTTTFSSSNPLVATVNSTSGTVTGVTVGTATITATSVSGSISITGTSVVTVSTTAPTPILSSVKIKSDSTSVKVGKTKQLKFTDLNQNGGVFRGATTTFSSANPLVATVDSTTGLVTGVAIGSATITVTSTSGNKIVTGTAIVKVVDTTIKTINTDNNGKHLGQYKHWFEKWFKKWEKRQGENIKNDHEKNDQRDNDNEGNDD